MFVAIISVDIKIGDKGSLKEKRKILRGIIDRAKNRFNVSVAEGGYNDLWQRTKIGFSIVSNDRSHANSSADKIIDYLHGIPDINIIQTDLEIIGL